MGSLIVLAGCSSNSELGICKLDSSGGAVLDTTAPKGVLVTVWVLVTAFMKGFYQMLENSGAVLQAFQCSHSLSLLASKSSLQMPTF